MGGEVTQFFCCMSNVVGAKILAVTKLIITIGNTISTAIAINESKEKNGSNDDLEEIGNGLLRFLLMSVAAIGLIDDIILMIGAFKKKRVLLIIWMVIASIVTTVGIFVVFWYISFWHGYSKFDLYVQATDVLINIWTLLVVGGAAKEIRLGLAD